MESLELDVPALIPQRVHDYLQIFGTSDVTCHDPVIGPIQEDLSKELERLSLGNIIGRQDEALVSREEL
jgi:hypothetical protein